MVSFGANAPVLFCTVRVPARAVQLIAMGREDIIRALVRTAAVLAISAPTASAQTLNLKVSFDEPQRPAPGGQKPAVVGASKTPAPAWLTATRHSLVLLAIEHGTRLALDSRTRNELSGPFFRDYIDSTSAIPFMARRRATSIAMPRVCAAAAGSDSPRRTGPRWRSPRPSSASTACSSRWGR